MSDAKFTIGIDFKGKDELNDILQKLLRKYDIDATVNLGKIDADIEKHILSPMRRVKAQFAEWGLVINGIKGSLQTVGMAYDRTIGEMVRAAQDAESAEMALKGSFRATGLEVDLNAQKMAQYAAELQKTTIYEDDMLKRQMAQMQNIGRFDNTDTLMGATKAAIGLSTAFGIDLATAMDLVGKAAAGNTSMLGRYGIVLNETASQAEKMSQLISIGTGYFKLAEDQARTSTGSVEQLKNTWGDLQEVLAQGLLPVITKLSTALKPLVEMATAMGSDQRAMTMGLIILNALVVKHTLAIMGQRAAFAALTVEQQHQVMSMMLLIGAQTGGTTSSLAFSLGMKSLGASLAAAGNAVKGFLTSIGPVGWIIIGITAAYVTLNAVLKVNTEAMQEKYQAENKLLEQKKEQLEKAREEERNTLKLTERYQQLAGQVKRNKAEQQELNGIHQKLSDKYPNLIKSTGNYKGSLEGVKTAAEKATKALADMDWQQWQLELRMAKNEIETNRVEAYKTLSKEFNWRDIWFSSERGTALRGLKSDMQTLISNDSSVLSPAYLTNLAIRLEDLSKKSKTFNNGEMAALINASRFVNMIIMGKQSYNELLKGANSKHSEQNKPDKGGTTEAANEQDSLLKRLDDFRILQEAAFQEEEAEKKRRERQYQDDLKLLGTNEAQKGLLKKEYDKDVAEIEDKYRKEREDREKQHYEELKFYDSGYYEWKKTQIESAGKQSFPNKSDDRQAWIDAQLAELEKEKSAWDNKAIGDFESQYETEMGHLSELQQLGLVTYAEIAKAAWGYYNALKAIVEVDGEVSGAEQEMLEKYLKRAEKAQLAANRDPDDVVSYYEQVKFLDSSYFEWKKKRIEDEVKLMEISAKQKEKILQKLLDDLAEEEKASKPNKTMFDYGLDVLGVPEKDRQGIKNSYQQMANEIAGIWSQMYANLDSQKNSALKKLETRAKNERKSEAWLAAEKEKINEQYEKKTRAMKRTEQKMQIASGMMNTFEGVTNALTVKPAWLAPIMAASIGALGLTNVGYIAAQKFAEGGSPRGLFRGVGSTTSDSNLIAISDQEYIIAADRVRKFGVGFFDALNFGNIEHVRNALASVIIPAYSVPPAPPKSAFNAGGEVLQPKAAQSQTIQVTLMCDSRELAKAVARGNKKTIRLN
ncbi:hypothetical protein MASR1M36_09030 [Candidatus Cloacimonadaceae bacterium]